MNASHRRPILLVAEVEKHAMDNESSRQYVGVQPGAPAGPAFVTAAPASGIPYAQAVLYGDKPVQCTCPHCNAVIVSRIERKTGLLVWVIFGILLLFGCWLGCCLIPFCVSDLKDVEHYCPQCQMLIGERRKL